MKIEKILLGTLTMTSLLLAGCGDGGGGDEDPATDDEQGAGKTILEGVWKKSCGINKGGTPSDPDVSFYDVITLTFSGNRFSSDIRNYSDADCSIPLAGASNPTAKGTFVLGGTITTTGGMQATEIDSHVTEYSGAPFQADEFGIVYVSGDTLYNGDDSGGADGTTPDLRPDTLDFERKFIRQ